MTYFNISKEHKRIFDAKSDSERQLLSQVLLGKDFKEVKDEFDITFKNALIFDDQTLIVSVQKQTVDDQRWFLDVCIRLESLDSSIVDLMRFASGIEVHEMSFPTINNGFQPGLIGARMSYPNEWRAPEMTIRLHSDSIPEGFVEKLEAKMSGWFDNRRA